MISRRTFNQVRMFLGALLVLGAGVFILKAALPAPMKMSDDELFKLVNGSTFTFIGTIKEMGNSNVSGIDAKDSMIVQVESVPPSDQEALKKLGDLKGSRLTVAIDSNSRIGLQKNISAVFFADPLVYEKNIGVTAIAVPVPDSKKDFLRRLHAAADRKSELPLHTEVKNADLIVVGEVVAVGPLPSGKVEALASVKNGWEIRSEHRPRWADAIIKVQQPVEKPPGAKVDFVSVVFPRSHDCFSQDSPKFEKKQKGIWLLFQNNQLAEAEKNALLKPEKYDGRDIQSYTALRPADFQDKLKLDKIRKVIADTR